MTIKQRALIILQNAPHKSNAELTEIFLDRFKIKAKPSSIMRRLQELRETLNIAKPAAYDPPKVFVFDIETTTMDVRTWQTQIYNTNIRPEQVKKDWAMLSWAGKWLNDSEMFGEILTPKEVKKRNDKRIVQSLWNKFDEADIVIAHNGVKFDVPNSNVRFVLNGLKPPSPYRVVDTLIMAKKKFKFTYNRLNYLGEQLGIGNKLKTDFDLWIDCENGNEQALEKMLKYNKQDVILLEDVYLALRGWMHSHPNMNVLQGTTNCCSNCGSENIVRNGTYTTNTNKYLSFQCNDCGAFSRKAAKVNISSAR